MYVCVCHGVTESQIAKAVDEGATRFRELRHHLRVATGCGMCASCAKDCLKQSLASRTPDERPLVTLPAQVSMSAMP